LSSFVFNRLESLQNFRACHDGLSLSEKRTDLAMVSRERSVRECSRLDRYRSKLEIRLGDFYGTRAQHFTGTLDADSINFGGPTIRNSRIVQSLSKRTISFRIPDHSGVKRRRGIPLSHFREAGLPTTQELSVRCPPANVWIASVESRLDINISLQSLVQITVHS
jgi:hypothetical protein